MRTIRRKKDNDGNYKYKDITYYVQVNHYKGALGSNYIVLIYNKYLDTWQQVATVDTITEAHYYITTNYIYL